MNLIDTLNEVRKLTKNEELYGGDLAVLSSVITHSVSRLPRSEGNAETLEVLNSYFVFLSFSGSMSTFLLSALLLACCREC